MDKIIMPKQGLQMTEGTITKWLISEGGVVTEGQPLVEIETDKVTVEIDALVSGTLLKIVRQEGETVPVAEVIAYVGEAGEKVEEETTGTPDTSAPQEQTASDDSSVAADSKPAQLPKSAHLASPRAKKAAKDNNIDIDTVEGSGPDGVIVERDVKRAVTPLAKKVAAIEGVDINSVQGSGQRGKVVANDVRNAVVSDRIVPMSPMRKVISKRMCESLTTMAQAFHNISVDATAMMEIREQYKRADKKISYNDIIVLAVSKALKEIPEMNSSIEGNNIILKSNINIGLAVSVDNGLLVPVMKQVQNLSLEDIASTSRDLIQKAQGSSLTSDHLSGGTFTISNLGMFDIDSFRAIVNPPEVGILAVGKIEKKAVVVDDQIYIKPMTSLCLTYDHRVVDGAPAAKFLMRIKQLLQSPMLML